VISPLEEEKEIAPASLFITHVTQKPKKVSETAIPSEIAAKP
jgi:hypothetical protein